MFAYSAIPRPVRRLEARLTRLLIVHEQNRAILLSLWFSSLLSPYGSNFPAQGTATKFSSVTSTTNPRGSESQVSSQRLGRYAAQARQRDSVIIQ